MPPTTSTTKNPMTKTSIPGTPTTSRRPTRLRKQQRLALASPRIVCTIPPQADAVNTPDWTDPKAADRVGCCDGDTRKERP